MKKILDYVFNLNEFKINYNFEDTKKIFKLLKNPQNNFKTIHITGTNGKGSTAKFLSNVLSQKYKVGLYTSPHMIKYNERFQINNKEIENKKLEKYINYMKNFFEKNKIRPSYFEFTTALCFKYFSDEKVDIAIIEVGMGGENDTTNVVNSMVSIITYIGLDHKEFLGDTKEKIAKEKIGILKKNTHLYTYEKDKKIIELFEKKVKKLNSKLFLTKNIKHKITQKNEDFQTFKVIDLNEIFKIKLMGNFQIKNAILCIYVCLKLIEMKYKINMNDIKKGLEKAENKGRFELLKKSPKIIFDMAHNKDSFLELLKNIKNIQNKKLCIFSLKKNKSISKYIFDIMNMFENVIITKSHFRPEDTKKLFNKIKIKNKEKINICDSENEIIEKIKKLKIKKKDFILCFGSAYLYEDFYKIFKKTKF